MTHLTGNAPAGTPDWLDLTTSDPARTRQFYSALLGWDYEELGPEAGHYTLCRKDGRQVAAIMPGPVEGDDGVPGWTVYFAAEDCDATVRRVTDAGGSVPVPADDVMDQGRMAIVQDTAGGRFGLWEGRAHTGAELVNEPGSLVWNELVTADPGAARRFYASVFDHDAEQLPASDDLDYTTLARPDGHIIGGIHGMPDTPATSWLTYFGVEDADRAVAVVRDEGGIAGNPWDSPYGRVADVRDPVGTPFRVLAG
ncbi:27 kDa antigen Cfp30B [Actinomadura rubteroloni]|uniref:27 kDa antigen Cfp30B n=1 Tax=Actinomadura rubteroloni TaxID=1926885 RepID=A0A2P4UB71_9ACTN|nr:VOC family protein [Actinomadura rubteroloni]POM22297.1 27 kDa antigen Cfp30B [Actinomadura rubteroloni]